MGSHVERVSKHTITAMGALVSLLVVGCSSSPTTSPIASTSHSTTTSPPTSPPTVTRLRIADTPAPAGFATPSASWIRIDRPDGKTQYAAVFRPRDASPHPAVVVLHGTGGLPVWQLAWAAKLAAKGYVVVSGCYLDAPAGWDEFLRCPGLPNAVTAPNKVVNARSGYTALLDAAVGLDGVEPDAIGVVGMSIGAGVALSIDDARVKAIVADSYYRETPGRTVAPVLLLGFTNDPLVPHAKLVAFERAQHTTGNPVESKYYPGALHLAFHRSNTTADATARAVTFLSQHLA